jgi:hypothetical protein
MTVRGLESQGDWLAFADGVTLHVECKRQEIARVWQWQAQALAESPPGTTPVVAFRRSHGQWWAMLPLLELANLLETFPAAPGDVAGAPAEHIPPYFPAPSPTTKGGR